MLTRYGRVSDSVTMLHLRGAEAGAAIEESSLIGYSRYLKDAPPAKAHPGPLSEPPLGGYWRSLRLVGTLAVDQPRYAEAVDDHAKTLGPEGFLERHDDCALFR